MAYSYLSNHTLRNGNMQGLQGQMFKLTLLSIDLMLHNGPHVRLEATHRLGIKYSFWLKSILIEFTACNWNGHTLQLTQSPHKFLDLKIRAILVGNAIWISLTLLLPQSKWKIINYITTWEEWPPLKNAELIVTSYLHVFTSSALTETRPILKDDNEPPEVVALLPPLGQMWYLC